jgi:hypothetical protein
VVAGADGDALGVDDRRDVVRVHAIEREREDGHALRGVGRPEHAQPLDLAEPLEAVADQVLLVRPQRVVTEAVEEVARPRRARCAAHVRRARLEPVRRLLYVEPSVPT